MPPKLSQFNVYSIGIVAANKPLSSKNIEVVPIEDSPMHNGELTDGITKSTASAKTPTGAAYSVEVTTTPSIKATWLPIGSSNRMTAPDVRRGETVILYQFAGDDQFWWATLKDDMHLRKLETVIYAFSATSAEGAKPSAENMYFLEISTHKKHIHLHTSTANGEPFKYDIQINTADGFIQFKDDVGNSFTLDSMNHMLSMVNQDGSSATIDRRTMSLVAPDSISLNTKDLTMNASSSIALRTANATLDAQAVTLTSGGATVTF